MLALARLAQRQLTLTKTTPTAAVSRRLAPSMAAPAIASSLLSLNNNFNNAVTFLPQQYQQTCGFATGNRKVLEAKNAKRLKIQAKKKKNPNKPSKSKQEEGGDELADSAAGNNSPFLQHQEWVKFQQSIAVDGFQTGQTVTASALKKSRGGKQARMRRERELERLQQSSSQLSSTSADLKYPAIRYSDEETQELLKMAYAALPERAGKRGTRSLKRQARRWRLVRKIRSKYKKNIIEAHERRMEKRSWKREQVKDMKEVKAPNARARDLEYQGQVLTRWSQTMFGGPEVSPTLDASISSNGKMIESKE